jgi:hypothetical protein
MAVHVAALPWKEIIKVLPSLVTTATKLWEQMKSQPRAAQVDPNDDPRKQIAALLQRIEALENAEVAQANLVRQMIEQLQGISAGLAETSRRHTLSLVIAVAALVLSVSALGIVLSQV